MPELHAGLYYDDKLSSFNAVYFVATFIVSPTSAAGVQISPLYLSVVDTALLNVLGTLLSLS